MNTKIWAHRGACKAAPENTMAAFRLALEMGAHGLELDVQLTKDAQVVVLHDEHIDRTSNGSGPVANYTLEELRAFDFSAGMEGFEGEPIPTLEEVYALIAPTDMSINVEIKAGPETDARMPAKLLALEEKYDMRSRIIYSSFNHQSLVALKQTIPHARLGLLYMCTLHQPWEYAKGLSAAALHPYINSMPENLLPQSHAAGIAVHPWTVDDPAIITALIKNGADAIITNYPQRALALLAEAKK
ncbi:glycerophosphodiester phosphodiesterase [Ruminococcaceae bacterium OttesenSCG-928-N02]|nr:glycerophosphodiester phosphodiesterase [Ruminococcaceae bacterium OttesenSCG-928-N02]